MFKHKCFKIKSNNNDVITQYCSNFKVCFRVLLYINNYKIFSTYFSLTGLKMYIDDGFFFFNKATLSFIY